MPVCRPSRFKFLTLLSSYCRFAIDTMQSICLDEFGGEKAVDPSSQETTLIQHIFGGHLQSQVMPLIQPESLQKSIMNCRSLMLFNSILCDNFVIF